MCACKFCCVHVNSANKTPVYVELTNMQSLWSLYTVIPPGYGGQVGHLFLLQLYMFAFQFSYMGA